MFGRCTCAEKGKCDGLELELELVHIAEHGEACACTAAAHVPDERRGLKLSGRRWSASSDCPRPSTQLSRFRIVREEHACHARAAMGDAISQDELFKCLLIVVETRLMRTHDQTIIRRRRCKDDCGEAAESCNHTQPVEIGLVMAADRRNKRRGKRLEGRVGLEPRATC